MERGFVRLHELPSVMMTAAVSTLTSLADGRSLLTSAEGALNRSWRCAVQLVV